MHLSGFNLGHALSGFYNRNVSVEFESTYIGSKKITNDLMNLKAGIIPNGIKIRYDSSGIISKSIEEIYMLATNSKPLELEDYLDYINTYEPDETKDCDIERKLKAFAQAMKENHIPKHEMTQLLIKYNDGNFLGEKVSENKENKTATYEIKLPSDKMFTQIHGEVKLIYTVHPKEQVVMLEEITPSKILLEGHMSELTTYKGIMISKANASKEMFKIDLLNMLQDKH